MTVTLKKTNFNALKLLIVLALILIVWNNVETFTLNTAGVLHTFSSYLCNPMLYVILMAFGYLSFNNNLTWSDYLKLILAVGIIGFITTFFYLDYFAFKEGYVTTSYLVGNIIKGLFFDYGKWVLWIIISLSALFKWLKEKFIEQAVPWKIIQITILVMTIMVLLLVTIVGLYYFINVHDAWYSSFNADLIYVSLREGSLLQIIPGILSFLIGLTLKRLAGMIKENHDLLIWSGIFGFIMMTCLRIIFHFPVIYWDVSVIIQAVCLLLPFLVWKLPEFKFINFLFYGSIFILLLHIGFNKLISVEFILGILIRTIFGLSVARAAVEFVNNNMFIALVYSILKVIILLMTSAWLSKQYCKLFKFSFLPKKEKVIKNKTSTKINQVQKEINISVNS